MISSGEGSASDRDKDTREQDGADGVGEGGEGLRGLTVDGGYMESDPLGLKSTPSSSPSQRKLSVELSSPASTVTVSPARADGEPKADAGRGMTATGAAAGGMTGGAPPCASTKGVEPEEDPRLPPLSQ